MPEALAAFKQKRAPASPGGERASDIVIKCTAAFAIADGTTYRLPPRSTPRW